MEQDVLKRGIPVVTVGVPAAGAQVNLHIPGPRRGIAELNDRGPEIGSALDADKTGMQDADGLSVGCLQPVATEALMAPDGLEQAFGREIIFVAQSSPQPIGLAPVDIKIIKWLRHDGLLLRRRCRKVKPAHIILNAAHG
jgi:hypothetical protein